MPLPPISGATAATGTPHFTENPSDQYHAWDASVIFNYMPRQFCTTRLELNDRAAGAPCWAGPGGVTPPTGNNGDPTTKIPNWNPDIRKAENRMYLAMLIKP